jgi:hypothetical protein
VGPWAQARSAEEQIDPHACRETRNAEGGVDLETTAYTIDLVGIPRVIREE